MCDINFVLLFGLVFHAINTTNILYRRGKLPLNNLQCENPAKMKILQVRLRGGGEELASPCVTLFKWSWTLFCHHTIALT
jgi:hypothetical protein